MFAALPEKELDWSDQGVAGAYRFLQRAWSLFEEVPKENDEETNRDKRIIGKMHNCIKVVTENMDSFRLSLAIGAVMGFVNALQKYKEQPVHKETYNECLKTLALLLCPFTPHLAEEMWQKGGMKGPVSGADWPKYEASKIDEKADASEELVEDTIADIKRVLGLAKLTKASEIVLFVSHSWKYDLFRKVKGALEETRNLKEVMGRVMDKERAKDIASIVPKLLKDENKIPAVVLNQDTEVDALKDNLELLKKEFDCDKIAVFRAEEVEEVKANQAMPGRAAIIVK